MDWLRGGVGELMIARPDEAKRQLVWKHPDPTIPMKSQLTVESDERCVFFRDGKVVATLGPGRHTLDSANLPFLSRLVDSFTGGRVFIAEVFFVSMTEQVGEKFGGRIGNVEDPKSGVPVETMVHGEFAFRVIDPEKLILGFVGMGNGAPTQVGLWMREQVLKVVRDRVAELVVKNKWPLLDVTSGAYTEELEADVLAGLGVHCSSYGLSIPRLGNFVVAIADGDAANLKKLYTDAAYLRTVGGVEGFQKFAAGKAMLGAGEGMAKGGGDGGGGGLLGGAGLGVGLGLAQQMLSAQSRSAGEPAGAPRVPCSSCGAHVAPGKFCGACGKELAAKPALGFCSGCGAAFSPEARFCGQCGQPRAGDPKGGAPSA
jgi:membrane protease subunit (stomatin/prohibitin family)